MIDYGSAAPVKNLTMKRSRCQVFALLYFFPLKKIIQNCILKDGREAAKGEKCVIIWPETRNFFFLNKKKSSPKHRRLDEQFRCNCPGELERESELSCNWVTGTGCEMETRRQWRNTHQQILLRYNYLEDNETQIIFSKKLGGKYSYSCFFFLFQ